MKINLLKSGKNVLAYVLAFCLLAVSLFTASVVVSAATVWEGTADTDWEGNGTEASPYILYTAEEVYGMVTSGGNGKYYRIADGVTALYFNDVEGMTKDQATAFFTGTTTKNSWFTGDTPFSGTFDGNGATLYGLYSVDDSGYNAFINYVVTDYAATVKNVNFDLCYFANTAASTNPWTHGSGVVFGRINKNTSVPDGSSKATATIEKVKVANCTTTSHNGAAILFGTAISASINLDRVITINNDYTSDNASASAAALIIGGSGWSCAGGTLSNVVITETGVTIPTSQNVSNFFVASTSAYTAGTVRDNQTDYFTNVTQDQMKGAAAKTNMPGLTWGAGGFKVGAEGEYPSFAAGEAYTGWDGKPSTGLELLDPTQENSESNPYLITSAADMLYLNRAGGASANATDNATAGKYYKVADGIKSIEFNPVSTLTTVDEVQAYFENEENVRNVYNSANASASIHYFSGTFDGNGCTFYGLYDVEQGGGLFAGAGAGAVIKNVRLANSYINSSKRAGGIVGQLGTGSSVTVQCCSVVDTFIHISGTNTNVGVGGIIGYGHAGDYTIDNCLVADCSITMNDEGPTTMHAGGFVSDGWGTTRKISNSIAIGVTPNSDKTSAIATFTNVYTDVECEYEGVTVLTDAELKGVNVQLEGLDYANTWVATTSYPELRVFHDIEVEASANGHKTVCKDTDCTANFGDVVAHSNWTAEFKCGTCAYPCPHDMEDNGEASPAECTNAGVMNTKCGLGCGYTSTRVIDALGHEFGSIISADDGNCSVKGNIAYKTCSVCAKNFAPDASDDSTEILATIENADFGPHSWGEEDSVVACNDVATYFKKCNICQKYAYSNGNNTSYDEEDLKDVAPIAADHSWVAQAPKTSECEGVADIEYDKCSVCNRYRVGTKVENAPPVIDGHAWGNEQKEESECDDGKDVFYKECGNCHKYLVGDSVVISKEALGHSLNTFEFGEGSGHFITECADCSYATMYVKIETEDYSVFADTGVFAPGVTVSIDKDEVPEEYKADVLESLAQFDIDAKDVLLYNIIALEQNGDQVQPNGSVTIKVAVPSTFSTNVKYYHIYKDEDQYKCEELELDKETGEIVLDHFSMIVVADLGEVEGGEVEGEKGEEKKEETTSSTTSTEVKKEETTSSTTSTNNTATSPATGDNLTVIVAGIALVIAAAFVLVRKSRKA